MKSTSDWERKTMQDSYARDHRIEFLQIDDRTKQALERFQPILRDAMPRAIKEFYDHIRKQPELIKMFANEASIARAADLQLKHWANLFSGRFGTDYFESARRIGKVHSRIGLEPRYYVGGYAFACNHIYAAASRSYGSRFQLQKAQHDLGELLRALNQAVMLDIDLAISIYIEENRDRYNTRLAELADNLDASVKSVVGRVATAARDMEVSAQSMASIAEQTGRQAGAVAAASEEASTNVQTVAAASEDLASSIGEIGRQVSHSADIAISAVGDAENLDVKMTSLLSVSRKIGEVVSLINNIASQTNLLALNATIEAARAGEAGKGFAVVAAEVKSLANQTARATDEIRSQIAEIQSVSGDAASAIQGITGTIRTMSEITAAIAAAVEEQDSATHEIARSVEQAAAGTNDVARNISGVTQAANETGETASRVLSASASLGRDCETLEHEVADFVGKMKMA